MKTIEKVLMKSQEKLLSCLGAKFLSMTDIKEMSKRLAKDISRTYDSDLVVGIKRGGIYPAYCLAEELQLPYTLIDISRKKTYVWGIESGQMLFIPRLLRQTKNEPSIKSPFRYEEHIRRAIIVDDDCGSMRTLNLSKSHLAENKIDSKSAVILNAENCQPDFFVEMQTPLSKLVKGSKRFPWSQYSPYFKDYQSWLEKLQ